MIYFLRGKRERASPAHGHIFLTQPHLKCFQIWSENIGQSQGQQTFSKLYKKNPHLLHIFQVSKLEELVRTCYSTYITSIYKYIYMLPLF